MTRALFLDFDGVLHPAGTETQAVQHFQWLPVLAELLLTCEDIVVVVHSTWRYTHTDSELCQLLGPLGPRFVGCVPRGPREESIYWFLQMNPAIEDYLILDDAAREFTRTGPEKLTLCDPERGISDDSARARIAQWTRSRPG